MCQAIFFDKIGSYTNTVRLSVMPKGVEHHNAAEGGAPHSTVRLSVMPKGVEHSLKIGSTLYALGCDYQ